MFRWRRGGPLGAWRGSAVSTSCAAYYGPGIRTMVKLPRPLLIFTGRLTSPEGASKSR
jgi:hypothetical protein